MEFIKYWLSIISIVLLHSVHPGRAECPQGFVEMNGLCVQRAISCPPNYVLVNGLCSPLSAAIGDNCSNGRIYVNGQCCPPEYVVRLQSQTICALPPEKTSPPPAQPCGSPLVFMLNPSAPIWPNYPGVPPLPVPPTSVPTTETPNESSPPSINGPTGPNTTPSYPLPPAELVRCPEGTIPINGVCRLVYCSKGTYKHGRCIQTECPEGTIWTGVKCAPPEPIVHSVVYNNTIITQVNRTTPDTVINNVNNLNLTLNVSTTDYSDIIGDDYDIDIEASSPLPDLPEDIDVDSGNSNSSTTVPPYAEKCCSVFSPRTCHLDEKTNHWNCYRKRYHRCGEFCTAPEIYLTAPIEDSDTELNDL